MDAAVVGLVGALGGGVIGSLGTLGGTWFAHRLGIQKYEADRRTKLAGFVAEQLAIVQRGVERSWHEDDPLSTRELMRQVHEQLTDLDRQHLYGRTEAEISLALFDATLAAEQLSTRVTEDGDDDDWDQDDDDLMRDFARALSMTRAELEKYQGR